MPINKCGKNNPNYGKRLSEDTKRKISENNAYYWKGKNHTKKTKKKMHENSAHYWGGKKRSEETKKKISASLKGRVPWNTGKKLSKEHKRKVCENHSDYWFGKKHSEEAKRKMSLSKMGQIPWNKGKKGPTPWNKGKVGVYSEEARRKMSLSRMGKKPSEKARRKIGAAHKGEKNYNWKGGVTPLYEQIRKSFEYRQWRSDVFTRDSFTCQVCGDGRGGNLRAHHIKEFSEIMEKYGIKTFEQALACEELWNINNGTTLCERCHKKIHRKK